ncbi:phytoene desaturase [Croceifilum oryzae]|uniref:4,4'-diaponeurosporene oxygenase n=1 Tax=Croceifilum oryzae TaxID=1553429 RepID=A0AAJ1TM05_9BACL|nr:NAD(P)/FAD-dependent oxidoreductase [Croceifilum oryzae]MDQ0417136.1 phytoene desaturase [Croceifilum oryzae]
MKKGVVIGGGIAGLVSASILSAQGFEITLLERNEKLGGKLRDIQMGEYQFDFGPSTITMPWVFEQVYREAHCTLDPELRFLPLMINSRNFFLDSKFIDLTADPEYMAHQMGELCPEDRQSLVAYLHETKRMYEVVEELLLEQSSMEWKGFLNPSMTKALFGVHAFQTMDSFHKRYFEDSRLLAMMNRYATQMGSSPYQIPATMAFTAYVEMVQGVHYVEGGNYRLIEALARLAEDSGVHVCTKSGVDEVLTENGQVRGVLLENGDDVTADFVISNVDIRTMQASLYPEKYRKTERVEPTLSSFLMLLGTDRKWPHLHHHNRFFPVDSGREYIDIFEQKQWSYSPTISVCNSSYTEPERAKQGAGSNLSVMVHVPANVGNQRDENWFERYYQYRDELIYQLEGTWGLEGLEDSIEVQQLYGPKEIEAMSGAWQGSLYGPVLHGRKAFLRPSMKESRFQGLYYTGDSTHPTGGAPMAALSGITIAKMVQQDAEHKMKVNV